MASKRVPLNISGDGRLWLSGGRQPMPEGTLRRAVAVAPELTGSVMSRWGSTTLYPIPAISLFKWNGVRYAYDGAILYANGVSIQAAINTATGASGFTGGKLTFITAPPQIGEQDYLFILGGGIKPFKIDPTGNVTLWGIVAPPNGATVQTGVADQTIVDNMQTDNTADWTHNANVSTLTFDTGDTSYLPGGCYKVVATDGPWFITKAYSPALDLSQYFGGDLSLQSDLISVYMSFRDPTKWEWIWLEFDVDDGTFQKNYYRLVIQLVATTSNVHAAGAAAIIIPDPERWIQLAGAKAQFQRFGVDVNKDWSNVVAARIEGGNSQDGLTRHALINGFYMYGGFPLGIGPAALTGGSEYQYAVTFGNSTTGSDSNPNGMQVQPDGTVNPNSPFVAQGSVLGPNFLKHLPLSTDAQVDNRKLWRTSAGGALFSYLDTIADNTTTTYTDVTGDLPGQPIIVTPWVKGVTAALTYKVDGGNGFWFKVTTAGTTGATIPAWNIPTGPFLGDWVPWITYAIGDWVNFNGVGYRCIAEARGTVQLPTNASFWTAIGTTNDNGVIWTWGGLNAVRTLALNQNLLYDNQQPLLAYGDAAGPFEGSILWTRDSTTGRKGWGYSSPPGRPESVGISFVIGSENDPSQKIVIYDQLPWALTTERAFIIEGSYPAFAPVQLKGGLGTSHPYTVVVAQNGIYYRGPDGIRIIDRAGSALVGFQNIAPVLRGRTVENVQPFYPDWGALTRDEIFFGVDDPNPAGPPNDPDNFVTFALGSMSPKTLFSSGPVAVWRILGQAVVAAYYEADDDEILASFKEVTVLWETEGAVNDGQNVAQGGILRVTQVSIEVLTPNV